MKKLILTLLFACSTLTTLYAQESLVIRDLSAGKVDSVDASLIPDNACADARNVLFDEEYPVSKRKGMTKLNSSAIGGGQPVLSQYEYKLSNGTRYHIAHSSTTVYYRLSGSAFTVLRGGVSSTYPANYCVFMDTLTWVDGVNNMRSWDTSAVFTQEPTYQPRFIIVWQNRIWIAGDADERSKVRCSEFLDPRDYTVPATPAATDPAVFDINSQDGQKVMGFALSPNGGLLIFKEKSVWEISGYDRDDFHLRLVLQDIGCTDTRSVAYKSGQVTWLSERGFVAYNGQSYSIISDNISNTVDSIQQLNPGGGSYSKDTESDWLDYSTNTFCDFTKNVGTLYPSFKKDTNENIQSTTPMETVFDGKNNLFTVCLIGSSMQVIRYNIHDSSYCIKNIDTNSTGHVITMGEPRAVLDSSSTIISTVYGVVNGSNNYCIYYASASVNDISTWYKTLVCDTGTNTAVTKVNCIDMDSNNRPVIIHSYNTGSFIGIALSSITVAGTWSTLNVLSSTATWENGDMVIDGSDNIHFVSFEETSNKIMYLSIPKNTVNDTQSILGTFNIDVAGAGADIDVTSDSKPQVIVWFSDSANNYIRAYFYTTSWDMEHLTSSGINGVGKIICKSTNIVDFIYGGAQFGGLVYKRRFLTDDEYSAGNTILVDSDFYYTTPNLYLKNGDVFMTYLDNPSYISIRTYIVCSSTSDYTGNIYDTGQTDTYYFDELIAGQFVGDYNITHYLRSDDSEANIATNTWTSVTVNSVPTVTPKRYIQYRCTISTDCISDNLSYINYVTLSWHGASGGTYISSMYHKDRIWNAVSISSTTNLDRQLVWDSNGAWADMYSYIGCSSLFNYNGTPYWGGNNGYIYTMNTGESDDGECIPAYVTTKAYDMGIMIQQKTLDGIYAQADDSGNWNLTLDYYLDRSGTAEETHNIDLDETSNLINYKIPFTKQLPFYTLQYKLSNYGANQPFDFLGLYTYFSPLPLR